MVDFHMHVTVNGREYSLSVKPTMTLTNLLREKLGFTSVKKGCETGDCGSCSVLVDNKLCKSCITLAPMVDGKEIVTIEGLSKGNEVHVLQKAFIEVNAAQCGFCSPGMILAAKVLLDEKSNPSHDEIVRAIAGNLCRCTGYHNPIKAIKQAADEISEQGTAYCPISDTTCRLPLDAAN